MYWADMWDLYVSFAYKNNTFNPKLCNREFYFTVHSTYYVQIISKLLKNSVQLRKHYKRKGRNQKRKKWNRLRWPAVSSFNNEIFSHFGQHSTFDFLFVLLPACFDSIWFQFILSYVRILQSDRFLVTKQYIVVSSN